jgi:hypothetical protein
VLTKSDLLKNKILSGEDSADGGDQGSGFSSLLFLPAGLAILFVIAAIIAIVRCRKKGDPVGKEGGEGEEDVTEPESATIELDEMEHDYTNPLGEGEDMISGELDDMVLSEKSGQADEML